MEKKNRIRFAGRYKKEARKMHKRKQDSDRSSGV